MSTIKMSDLCKRIGLVSLCVVLLCTVIGLDRIIGSFAAAGDGSADANTKEFNFASDLGLFEMWYAPTLTPEDSYPAIAGADSVWRVDGGVLKYQKDDSLYHDANTLRYNENDITQDFMIYNYRTHDWGSVAINNVFDHPVAGQYVAGSGNFVNSGGITAWPVKDLDPAVNDARQDAASDTVHSLPGNEGRSRNFGYLDFAPWVSKDDGFSGTSNTRVMTHKEDVNEFSLEVDFMMGISGNYVATKGIMIAPDGEFAFSNDENLANDTGLFITFAANGSGEVRPVIAGAIKPETATATVGGVSTNKASFPLSSEPLLHCQAVVATSLPIGTASIDYRAIGSELYGANKNMIESATAGKMSMAVKVENGKVSVWNPHSENGNVLTVDLNENYAGGRASLWATSTWQGAFAGFRLDDKDIANGAKKWDYSYSATRNQTVHNWNPQTSTYTGTLVEDVIPSSSATKEVTYKSKDNANNNYAIALLNAKEYGNFTLEMDVKGGVMVGFGANNTSTGVFPAQQNGGYAFLVNASGAAKLIGYGNATAPWGEKATANISNYSATATHKYKVVYNNGTATLTVDNNQVFSQNVGTGVSGYIYLAANTEGTGIGNLKVTGSTADTYPLDKVQQMQSTFDNWYMPVGNATEEVPAYNQDEIACAGNWYIDGSFMYFVEDHELKQDDATLSAGITKTIKVDSGMQGTPEDKTVIYKSTDDEINYVGNYGIAMLKTPYTDFRLEVKVKAGDYVPYIGFGAKGGHYGAHIGQADGGYAFLVKDYNQQEGLHSGPITPQGSAKIVGFNNKDTAGQVDLANKKIAYDLEKDHTYVIEVLNKKVTVKVDDVDTGISEMLEEYEGGYIYLASNNEVGGFTGLKITDLSVAEVVVEEPPVDLSKTVSYTFSDEKALDDFKAYFAYSAAIAGKPAINVATEDNWYLDDEGFLTYKQGSLQKTDTQLKEGFDEEVTLEDGGKETVNFVGSGSNPKWTSNFGVAMLNTSTYENFIMDVDFRATTGHFYIGFGAKGGNYGIMPNTANGGYAFHFSQNGTGKDETVIKFEYTSDTALKTAFNISQAFDYNSGATHHIRIVVSDGTMYAFLDGATAPMKVALPNYQGGYIYFGLNGHNMVSDGEGGFDNLRITDLDAKQTKVNSSAIAARGDVTIDRSKGEELIDYVVSGALQDCEDVNGYPYSIPVTYNSDTYRSYSTDAHTFKLEAAKSGWHNFVFEGPAAEFVVNSIPEAGLDPETTRKYYFDHINDLKDFMAYTPKLDKDGAPNADGLLEEIDVMSEWTVTEDGKLVNLNGGWPGSYSKTLAATTQHTLLLKDLQLYDFHYQFDYEHLPRGNTDVNYWYNYMIVGCQEPTVALRYLNSEGNLAFNAYTGVDNTFGADPGIWFWTVLNRADLDGDGPETAWGATSASIYYAGDVYAYEKRDFESAMASGDEQIAYRTVYVETLFDAHTMKVTMVNGQFAYQLDNSPIIYRDAQNEAVGGYVGLATHYHGSPFDNLTITALDKNGQPMKIADAKQGMAPAWRESGYAGWDASDSDDFEWDPEVFTGIKEPEETE